MSKSIDTLVEDIYDLLENGKVGVTADLLSHLGSDVANTMQSRLQGATEPRRATLRMSSVGRPDRQLWYDVRGSTEGEKLLPSTLMKFLFGDVWESIILYLAAEAGHKVEHPQKEVEINGIVGHNDAVIDGVLVDVKSASPYGFRKFKYNEVEKDDPFGYMEQLAAYSKAFGDIDAAFLAVNKVNGELALAKYSAEDLAIYNIEERIDYVKEMVESSEIPDRCYADIPEGKSGNMTLDVGCRYCPYKDVCWSDVNNGVGLRSFIYSSGPKFFTKVVKEPRTREVTF